MQIVRPPSELQLLLCRMCPCLSTRTHRLLATAIPYCCALTFLGASSLLAVGCSEMTVNGRVVQLFNCSIYNGDGVVGDAGGGGS